MIAKHAADSGPVWIIGSGKTAMDVALVLQHDCPGRELNMVAGSGTMFQPSRDVLPYWPGRRDGGTGIERDAPRSRPPIRDRHQRARRRSVVRRHLMASARTSDGRGDASPVRATRARRAGTDARPCGHGEQGTRRGRYRAWAPSGSRGARRRCRFCVGGRRASSLAWVGIPPPLHEKDDASTLALVQAGGGRLADVAPHRTPGCPGARCRFRTRIRAPTAAPRIRGRRVPRTATGV